MHYGGLAIFWLTTLHAFLVGTDATNRALLIASALSVFGVGLLVRRAVAGAAAPLRAE